MTLIQKSSFSNWLNPSLGRSLVNVSALVFVSGVDANSFSIEELRLTFKGLEPVRIFCGSDGSSICWDNDSLQAINLGEYGEEKVCDLSCSDEFWKSFVNRKLEKAYCIESEIESCVFAVQLVFEEKLQLVIANLGDSLVIQDQLSVEVIEGERAKFVDIQAFYRG